MIYLEVSGKMKKEIRNLVEELFEFGRKELLPRVRNLNVNIHVKSFEKDDDGLSVYGYCETLGDREFLISVNKENDLEMMVETVLHEMVHVKQYVRGELSECGVVWKGKDCSHIKEYMSLPWEIEAHALEAVLVKEYKLSKKES